MEQLTKKQERFLCFLHAFSKDFGFPPTFREMCEYMGWKGTNCASDYLKALERKGYIKRNPRKSRAIAFTDVAKNIDPQAETCN